jgi:hypothetical protein
MRQVIYDGSVLGQARDPLECFSPSRPTAGLVPRGSSGGGFFQGRRYVSLWTDQRAPFARGLFLGVLADRWAIGVEDHIPNSSPEYSRGVSSLRGFFLGGEASVFPPFKSFWWLSLREACHLWA